MSIVTTTLPLDPSYTGASLRIQYYEYDSINDERDAVGSPVSTGIFELAGGEGLFVLALDIPVGFTLGWADVYVNGAPGVILASIPIGADEDVQALVEAALTAYDAATGADVAGISGGNVVGAIEFTYTVTIDGTDDPLSGVQCWFCTDEEGTHPIWYGVTDAFGIVRDGNGDKPRLDTGVYTIVRHKVGYVLPNDTETVSNP